MNPGPGPGSCRDEPVMFFRFFQVQQHSVAIDEEMEKLAAMETEENQR